MSFSLRLIMDTARSATLNMALDEWLMECEESVLRFYTWDRPAVSIGYFQNARAVSDRFKFAGQGIRVVRRLTGGGLILHGKDLTFSLCLPDPNSFFQGPTEQSYREVNEACFEGLRAHYPEIRFAEKSPVPSGRGGERVCFESPSRYDLLLGGHKIAGASQRRKDGRVLHQSTIFLDEKPETLAMNLAEGFRRKWGVRVEEKPLSESEIRQARQKESRYLSEEWAAPALGAGF